MLNVALRARHSAAFRFFFALVRVLGGKPGLVELLVLIDMSRVVSLLTMAVEFDGLKALQRLSQYEVGLALREKRMAVDLSIAELGARTNMTYDAIRSFERGTTVLSEEMLKKLAGAYEIQPEILSTQLLSFHRILEQEQIAKNPNILERRIEFPREYKQAGVSLLSEFTNILQSEFGEESASVCILQNGNAVTLRIEDQNGKIKEIEKRLDDYGSVLRGELPIENFTQNRDLAQELKVKFEVVALELRLTKERYLEYRTEKTHEVEGLRMELADLRKFVASAFTYQSSMIEVIKSLTAKNSVSDEVLLKLTEIASLASESQTKANKELLKQLLVQVQKKEPSFFAKMTEEIAAIPAAIAGGVATPWVQSVLSALPK